MILHTFSDLITEFKPKFEIENNDTDTPVLDPNATSR